MTYGKQTTKMTADELNELIATSRTVTVTFTGEEYAAAAMLAENRGQSIEQYLKTLVREETDAAIELAKLAGAGAAGKDGG
jgi:hypothetical protein